MIFLQLVLSLDKTIEGVNSILPIVSYRNIFDTETIQVIFHKANSGASDENTYCCLLVQLNGKKR